MSSVYGAVNASHGAGVERVTDPPLKGSAATCRSLGSRLRSYDSGHVADMLTSGLR